MEEYKFHGIIPPVPTILTEDYQLDKRGMGRLIDFLIDSGVRGLFFLGSGGEFTQFTTEQRKEIAAFVTSYVNKRVPVLIGTGSTSTTEVLELNAHAITIDADGVVIINPYYFPMSEENLYRHYASIAEETDLAILLYNFPDLTGQDLTPSFVLKLASQYEHIVGIKETVHEANHIREMIRTVKKHIPSFCVFSGYDDHLANTLMLGGAGGIPATTNFVPELTVGIYEAYRRADYEKVVSLHQELAPVLDTYQMDKPFVNVVKEAICYRGLPISPTAMPPVGRLAPDKKETLHRLLANVYSRIGVNVEK